MTKQDEQFGTILAKVDDIQKMTTENRNVLLGKDGSPGLVGNFVGLCARVSGLEQLLNNDIAHLSAKIDMMFSQHEVKESAINEIEITALKRVKELEDANTVKRTDLLREWVKPILVSILTAVLVWFIVTNGIAGK
jgi:hypothetical protein